MTNRALPVGHSIKLPFVLTVVLASINNADPLPMRRVGTLSPSSGAPGAPILFCHWLNDTGAVKRGQRQDRTAPFSEGINDVGRMTEQRHSLIGDYDTMAMLIIIALLITLTASSITVIYAVNDPETKIPSRRCSFATCMQVHSSSLLEVV